MLVTRRAGGFTCITQYDHGAVAGELAARWGNDRFAAPALAEALRLAAAHHDDGWRELDDLPAHNEEAGRPAHFLELPLERTAPPYGRGVDSVYARDPLAGALVGMHWTGLYSGRWRLQSSGAPSSHPLAREVVAGQEPRYQAALREAWSFAGPRSRFQADVWHAYEVLQALDVISLALSLADPSPPGDAAAPAQSITAVLAAVEQPPGARILPMAPTGPLGDYLDLTMTVTASGEATIVPWPFGEDSFEVELPARGLPGECLSEAESAAAFRAAPVEPIHWLLRAG